MKRSKSFILTELLMTVMLHTGFILLLCGSFYMLISFYTRTQQILTARNHAERVISFIDGKIRNAGLGLWGCGASCGKIRDAIKPFTDSGMLLENFKLPVAVMKNATDTEAQTLEGKNNVQYGSYLTLLYGERDLTSGPDEKILIVTQTDESVQVSEGKYQSTLSLLDGRNKGIVSKNPELVKTLFKPNNSSKAQEKNMEHYAVTEATGMPMYIYEVSEKNPTKGQVNVYTYGSSLKLAAASELIPLKCMQMFVHDRGDGQGRQFAFHNIKLITYSGKIEWGDNYNQEKGVLDIYMELDTDKNIFTLWVLGTGGYDSSLNNPPPASWPKNANWYEDYSHHLVYVSRASWRLNNIPQNFTWN